MITCSLNYLVASLLVWCVPDYSVEETNLAKKKGLPGRKYGRGGLYLLYLIPDREKLLLRGRYGMGRRWEEIGRRPRR